MQSQLGMEVFAQKKMPRKEKTLYLHPLRKRLADWGFQVIKGSEMAVAPPPVWIMILVEYLKNVVQ